MCAHVCARWPPNGCRLSLDHRGKRSGIIHNWGAVELVDEAKCTVNATEGDGDTMKQSDTVSTVGESSTTEQGTGLVGY
jgi:hypothetical protein